MPIVIRRFPLHRRGRELTAGRVLYVTRRLPTGRDAKGVETFRVPGEVFDPTGIPEQRVKVLFRARFIGHELPHGVEPIGPSAPSPAAPPPVAKPATPPRAPRARNTPGV
jgi:hypothetical protein